VEYKPENRICQNCKKEFTIEPDDFGFYEKIKVPPPTFCPECRYIRRLLDRNEYNLYKRKCDATGEDIISIYRADAPFPVYKQEYWKSDKFEATEYGRDFDFTRSFFEQYDELRRVVPHLAMVNFNSVNSEYTNQSDDNKDCYMLVTSGLCDKCMYGSWCSQSFFCSDCYMVEKGQFCYECINMTNCSNCRWCFNCSDCVDVYFSFDCRGCTNCFGCVGLRSKNNCWFNEQLTREEYQKRIGNFFWDRKSIQEMNEKVNKFKLNYPFKYYQGFQAQDSSGDYMQNTKRARMVFNCRDHQDTAYMQDAWGKTLDCRDCTEMSVTELCYEMQGVSRPHRSIAIRSSYVITDSYYCDMCSNIENCLGCFGLRDKKYCILNKQYNKEEYFKLKEKIIEHMRKTGEWGEYFPAKYSPFAYNESMVQDYFPLTREKALQKGYNWYDRPDPNYSVTLNSKSIPKTIQETRSDILDQVIQCKTQENEEEKKNNPLCTTAFRITSLELALYQKLGIPIPEYCFPCRRTARFKFRNPRKLWHRKCMKEGCQNEFKTSYAPDRPEIVYCEKCYQAEVY
jgi:hypothetical protein